MNFESIKSGDEATVQEFEKQLGFDLPKDYKNFLIQNDGVKFVNYCCFYVNVLKQKVLIDVLYDVTGAKKYSIARKNNTFKDEIPENSVLIGEDPGGTPILLICEGKNSGVYLFDNNYFFKGSSDEQNTYWLADTFTAFMNSLICDKE